MPLPQEQPVESFKVSGKDIQAFLGSDGARSSGTFNLHGLAGIKKDLYDNSLRSLRGDLASDLLSFQDLKAKYAPLLLKDIEEFSESMQHKPGIHPKFQESFKDEVNKPHNERSEEFKAFMKYYRNTGEANSSIIKVTMEMLDAFDRSSEPQEISTALNKELREYGGYSHVQAQKDLRRGVIILKDQDGQARVLSVDDLDKLQITDEQRGFIQNAWDQRSFKGGWLSVVSDPEDLNPKITAVQGEESDLYLSAAFDNNSTDLIIDLSQEGQVKLYNKTGMAYSKICPKRTDDREFIQAVLEVDISSLQGESFTHGCASAEPEINFYISTFDPTIKVEFPKGLKLTESADLTRQIEDIIKSCIQEIAKDGNNKERALMTLNRMIEANQAELVLDIVLDSSLSKEEKLDVFFYLSLGNEETVFSDIIHSRISEMEAKKAKDIELEEKDTRLLELPDLTRQIEDTIKSCIQEIAKDGNNSERALTKLSKVFEANKAELVLDIVLLDPNLSKAEKRDVFLYLSFRDEKKVLSDITDSRILEIEVKRAKGIELEEQDTRLLELPDLTRQIEDIIKSCIQEIAKDGNNKERALTKLSRVFEANKAELVLDIVLLDPNLKTEEKKSVLSTISKGNEENVFSDIIQSRISDISKLKVQNTNLSKREDIVLLELIGQVEVSVPPDQLEQALAVQYYNLLEEDPQKREQFAAKQLSKYVDSLKVTKLDEKKTAEISKALIAIMEPICTDEKEKEKLRGSADMLVRECASRAGTKMSFGQAWHTYVVDPIKQLLGRKSDTKNLEKYEQIAGTIKNSLTTAERNKQLPRRGAPPKDVGGRGL